MPSAHLTLKEEDVVKLSLEFLHNRSLHISQLSVERETGVINGIYSDDLLFLRQLILDGQWDDVLEFVQPLEAIENFDQRHFQYLILRQKYVELLCIKSEAGASVNMDSAVDEVVKVLNELEKYAPSKDDYSNLCLLLTLPRLTDHSMYREWNPSNARVQCFRDVFPLVEKFLPCDKKVDAQSSVAQNDRLIQLVIKGLLYESCVDYCQQKATSKESGDNQQMKFASLLNGTGFSDSDLSLLSWLQSIPNDTFACPFEQRTLNVDVERLEKPSLETSWTEHMLVTPIKPKLFPHSAMPYSRPKSADIMSRSLMPSLEGLPFGLGQSRGVANTTQSASELLTSAAAMSRSFTGFHLTGGRRIPGMATSVDRLFDGADDTSSLPSSSYTELPVIVENKEISDLHPTPHDTPKKAAPKPRTEMLPPIIAPKPTVINTNIIKPIIVNGTHGVGDVNGTHAVVGVNGAHAIVGDSGGTSDNLYMEYQKQKARIQEEWQEQERRREELLKEIEADNRKALEQYNRAPTSGPPPLASRVPPTQPTTNGVNHILTHVQQQFNRLPPPSHSPPPPPSTLIPNLLQPSMGIENSEYDAPKSTQTNGTSSSGKPRFIAVTSLEDVQAVRCAEFHPQGKIYAVGSNSKTLRICAYPKIVDLSEDHEACQPTVLFKRTKHHKGSIYCLAWSPAGDLIATGSNDKTVKLIKFNADTMNMEGQEIELTMHDGTIRDVCFIEDMSNKSSLLISGGAGDCKIYITDCMTGTPFQALSGHSGHVLALYNWGGAMFVSGSQDKTVRFWDLRTRGCVNMVNPTTSTGARGSPVASVCVDPSGRLLVTGHEDANCVLFDIRGGRAVQTFRPHSSDVRSIRFSPSAYYLLTAGYDNKLVLTDLQGDLMMALPSVVVAQHQDKAISARWHPTEFSFVSTSADKTSTLWALPPI